MLVLIGSQIMAGAKNTLHECWLWVLVGMHIGMFKCEKVTMHKCLLKVLEASPKYFKYKKVMIP